MRGIRSCKSGSRHLPRFSVCLLLLLPFLAAPGCGSKPEETTAGTPATGANAQSGASPATASDADMRKSFSQKGFDINNVPPEQRDRVKAMMQQNAASKPSASSAQGKQ